jgi:methylglyoxal synthase
MKPEDLPTPVTIAMSSRKRIALIAHDNRKDDMLDWARYNRGTLSGHELYATGTTGVRASRPSCTCR